jgi:ribokinase
MSKNKPKVTVIGSINMDLVTQTTRVPSMGETLLGESFKQFPGGKGANQAVASARLGGEVSFIGCVGNDLFGQELKHRLEQEQVNIEGVDTTEVESTGVAQITVSNNDNSIIVVPGANYQVSQEWIDQKRHLIENADIVLTQLEIPMEIVERVVDIAHVNGVPVILNPAPAQKLSPDLLKKVTYLTPNESELDLLTSKNGDVDSKIFTLQQLGVENLIVTRGADGVVYREKNASTTSYKESLKVKVIDSTGAGDAFNGALAVAIGSGKDLGEALDFSVRVGALSVTKLGAQSGIPNLSELI